MFIEILFKIQKSKFLFKFVTKYNTVLLITKLTLMTIITMTYKT